MKNRQGTPAYRKAWNEEPAGDAGIQETAEETG
jgi:hypothetical protein